MKIYRSHLAIILAATLLLWQRGSVDAQTSAIDDHGQMDTGDSSGAAGEPAEVQMARAIAAGPRNVTSAARIVGADMQGKTIVLREGSNGFTCQAGNPKVVGRPASCSNEAARQWNADMAAGKASPSNTQPGIIYMLAGATERNASGQPVTVGPHWMIIWPFDPKTTGLSATRKDTGAYIMLAGTPYAHVHIMGRPDAPPVEHLAEHDHMADMNMDGGAAGAGESTEIQMARAIAAGPKHITDGARIMGVDAQGKSMVLREGTNGFSCQPGNPKVVAQPASCSSMNSKPTITYMIAGATQYSISDPTDKTSPAVAVGPHWMIMMPLDPKATGLPVTYSDTGAYIMWAGSRSAHLHIMGIP